MSALAPHRGPFRLAGRHGFFHAHAIERLYKADLVIGAVLVAGVAAPKLVTAAMVKTMKPGAVLVDIAIDQGGCFETSRPTTHAEPTYLVYDVVHYCVSNMPGAVAANFHLRSEQCHPALRPRSRQQGLEKPWPKILICAPASTSTTAISRTQPWPSARLALHPRRSRHHLKAQPISRFRFVFTSSSSRSRSGLHPQAPGTPGHLVAQFGRFTKDPNES